jgi:hypothetical protein
MTRGVIPPTMVRAFQAPIDDLAQRQRHVAVRATIQKCRRLSGRVAINREGPVKHRS